MFVTISKMADSEKLRAKEPFTGPVRPTIPVTSPREAASFFLRLGFPAFGSVKAMVLTTFTTASRKGLINSTFMPDSFLENTPRRLVLY
jgi:hypothetical protein